MQNYIFQIFTLANKILQTKLHEFASLCKILFSFILSVYIHMWHISPALVNVPILVQNFRYAEASQMILWITKKLIC